MTAKKTRTKSFIKIKDLEVKTLLGVYAKEKYAKRKVIINAKIYFDASDAIAQDSLSATIDYDLIENTICSYLAKKECSLIEVLASEIIHLLFEDSRITKAKIKIDKPGALKNSKSVAVVMQRSR